MPAVAPRLAPAAPLAAVLGAGDPASTRLVYAMVIGLVVIGVVLILLAIWILRQTRPDLEVLAPLERMGDGDWKKKDPSTQRRMLDELRPDGAEPLAPASMPPSIDREFEATDHPVTSFSDLGPGVAAESRDPTPTGADGGTELDLANEAADQPEASVGDLGADLAAEQRDPTPNEPDLDFEPTQADTEPAPDADSLSDPLA